MSIFINFQINLTFHFATKLKDMIICTIYMTQRNEIVEIRGRKQKKNNFIVKSVSFLSFD